jgi:phosphoribosylglycinamide formyltransferase-1
MDCVSTTSDTARGDAKLARLSRICLALSEAQVERHRSHATFSVRRRNFAYYLDDHHGDGMVALNCKVPPGVNEHLAEMDPKRFHIPAYVGHRGWVGLRLDVGRVDWAEVADLVTDSYRLVAPKTLASAVVTPTSHSR